MPLQPTKRYIISAIIEQKTGKRRVINQDLSRSSTEEFPIGNKSALRDLIESDRPVCGVVVRRATRRSVSNLSRQTSSRLLSFPCEVPRLAMGRLSKVILRCDGSHCRNLHLVKPLCNQRGGQGASLLGNRPGVLRKLAQA